MKSVKNIKWFEIGFLDCKFSIFLMFFKCRFEDNLYVKKIVISGFVFIRYRLIVYCGWYK